VNDPFIDSDENAGRLWVFAPKVSAAERTGT